MLSTHAIWNPWREVEALRRNMSPMFEASRRWNLDWADDGPAFNVYTGNAGVVLTAELPGFDPEAFEIIAERDIVTVRGKRNEDRPDGGRAHSRERGAIEFEKRFRLPFAVDAGQTEASYEKGVLTVRLGRPEEQKPQRIGVRTA